MTIVVGVKCAGQAFAVKSTAPLDILPRIPLSELRLYGGVGSGQDSEEEIEPLPLYAPREPSKEFAPNYETLYALTGSASSSRSASLASGATTPSTAPTTPGVEIGEPVFGTEGC